jgi:hypothetical protein
VTDDDEGREAEVRRSNTMSGPSVLQLQQRSKLAGFGRDGDVHPLRGTSHDKNIGE